jgi:hypothetical protein
MSLATRRPACRDSLKPRLGSDTEGCDAKTRRPVRRVVPLLALQPSPTPHGGPQATEVSERIQDWCSSAETRFGLFRANTLLHFISYGRDPIFDSRVRRAASRLLDSPVPNTVQSYLDSYSASESARLRHPSHLQLSYPLKRCALRPDAAPFAVRLRLRRGAKQNGEFALIA